MTTYVSILAAQVVKQGATVLRTRNSCNHDSKRQLSYLADDIKELREASEPPLSS
jgi:hypothetical protein